tara:strand:+ start:94766 stop:95830 length:1065 start_codon:yes stop_codon:yes gene_type:complete
MSLIMNSKSFMIGDRQIGEGHSPYIIAELSGNHNGNLTRALKIIDAAADAGADAIKLQTYTPDTMTINCNASDFVVKEGLWKGRTLYELYEEAHTPWEWHGKLFSHARSLGLEVFSTPFDNSSVDFLEDIGVSTYKVASFELTDHALLRKVAQTGKPVIMSTGMASKSEISESVQVIRDAGCQHLCLLYCVSGYPTPIHDANLLTMQLLEREFGVVCGFSDHTPGTAVSVAAVALGARVVEKHFTLDRSEGGPDAAFSLEPSELTSLVRDCRAAWEALGRPQFHRKNSEETNVVFRRSVYAVKDIAEGEIFTTDNIRVIRPGYGMAPKYLESIIGRAASKSISRGTPIDPCLLD